ncbi:HCNGP-like protein-domain-containing protein [Rhizoctonia solani]|nr:HCNGP-like protein-domain-containing protein [Rhizoctonia solani]
MRFDICPSPVPNHNNRHDSFIGMQSIIGYSDDDRSDDEIKRSSPAKPRSKDSLLRKSISTPVLRVSSSAEQVSLANEPRDHEDTDSSGSKQAVRPNKSKSRIDSTVIRRTTTQNAKQQPEQPDKNVPGEPPRLQDLSLEPNAATPTITDDLTQIRTLLRPSPIPGVENFGILPPSEDPVDTELAAKISKFLALKKQGTHFNDILMKNKSFNNPHIYAKLVDFVEVDETGTNFPKSMWDPHDIQPEWYADEIATAQKKRGAEAAAAQALGKRSRIAFDSTGPGSTSGVHPSMLQKGNKHSDESRGRHSDDSRGRRSESSKRRDDDKHGGQRYHPYQHKSDANMGWMPRNHSASDRSRRW